VGGDQEDNSLAGAGAVYVFVRNGVNWSQQAYLKASNTGAGDGFGGSVALDGDTLVVGAPAEDSAATGVDGAQANNSATDSGAVYVFARSGAIWSQTAYLKASNTDAGDKFGTSVAVSGDTVVAGAPGEDSVGDPADNSSQDAGAAYAFVRNGSTWSQQAYVKAPDTSGFGISAAISGDTLVAGCLSDALGGRSSAYVFARGGGEWAEQAQLGASNGDLEDRFGWSVAVSGDTVLVGAPQEDSAATGVDGNQGDNSASDSGAAYVFARSGSTWPQRAYLKASNAAAGDRFGVSVALSRDAALVGALAESGRSSGVNGDGDNRGIPVAGAAYQFIVARGGTWSQAAYLKASIPNPFCFFGTAVSISEDTLVVGATGESARATGVNATPPVSQGELPDSGAAYVFGGVSSDVSISMTAEETSSAPGFMWFTVTATNSGPSQDPSTNVMVRFDAAHLELDAEVGQTYVDNLNGIVVGDTIYFPPSAVNWVGSPPSQTRTFSFPLHILDESYFTELETLVTVEASAAAVGDSNPANDASSVSFKVVRPGHVRQSDKGVTVDFARASSVGMFGASAAVASSLPEGFNAVAGSSFEVTTTTQFDPTAGFTITIPYDPALVTDATTLQLRHWDAAAGDWVNITVGTADTTAHTVSGRANSFSPFAIVTCENPPDVISSASSQWSVVLILAGLLGVAVVSRGSSKRTRH
jgi:hypothetical protein